MLEMASGPLVRALVSPALDTLHKFVDTAVEAITAERRLRWDKYVELRERAWREQQAEAAAALERERMEFADRAHADQMAFARERLLAERETQWQVAHQHYRAMVDQAAIKRQALLESTEYARILQDFPLTIYPTPLLEGLAGREHEPLPLLVILSPPEIDFDPASKSMGSGLMVQKALEERVRSFLDAYRDAGRHIEFLGGAWRSKQFSGEAASRTTFAVLRSRPTLILECEADSSYLSLRIAYWDLGASGPTGRSVLSRVPYRDVLYEIARDRARAWRVDRERYVLAGKSDDELLELGGTDERNHRMLEREEEAQQLGAQSSRNSFQIDAYHLELFAESLAECHILLAGLMADVYHLVNFQLAPVLPSLLASSVRKGFVPAVLDSVVETYLGLFRAVDTYLPAWKPELLLALALQIGRAGDRARSGELIEEALGVICAQRRISSAAQGRLARISKALGPGDQALLEALVLSLDAADQDGRAEPLRALLSKFTQQRLNGTLTWDSAGDTLYDTWG